MMLHLPYMLMSDGYVHGSAMRLIGKLSNSAESPTVQDYSINRVSKLIGVSKTYPQLSLELLPAGSERGRLKTL